MSVDTSTSKINVNSRKRPPKTLNVAANLRTAREIGIALLVFTAIAWLIWQGALAMEYKWQWYRVSPFFYRIVDDEFIFLLTPDIWHLAFGSWSFSFLRDGL